jgi:hypothetical protein
MSDMGADMAASICDVLFTPNSGHSSRQSECPLWAKSSREQVQQNPASNVSLFDHIVGRYA